MLKTFIPLFLIVTVSCAGDFCEDPDFEAAGLKICTDSYVDPEEIAIVAKIVEQKVREVYPQVPTHTFRDYKRNDIRVQFVDEFLAIGCDSVGDGVYTCETIAGGVTTETAFNIYKIRIYYNECLIRSSFDHELLHVIEFLYLDGPQGEEFHSRPYMFKLGAWKKQGIPIQDTIEQKIYEEARPILQSCVLPNKN